jgi:hypothetical protein
MRFRFTRSLKLRWAASTLLVLTLIVGMVPQAFANLSGSTFEGNDGNLVFNTTGNTDWSNAPNRVVGIDQPSGSSDNAFGQGTKEDNVNVTVVDGSIPPNKNDLTRFYVASEAVGGSNFLYLAWERLVNIGAANLDFEISQHPTAGFTGTTTGPVALNRTAGDLLVTYDFGGSGTPTLGLLKWVTSGANSQCFSANSTPCWGNRVNLTAAGFAEGAVNTGTVSDPIAPNAPRSLTVGLFGEAAVNLTAAGVFPANTCTAFGSVFVKSRSSSSFPAEIKDFIAPQPVNISNCGTITIHKTTIPAGGTGFGYTTTGGLTPATFSLDDAGTRTYSNVLQGNYSVTEGTKANWALTDLTCSANGSGTSVTPNGSANPVTATASITIGAGGVVDCTYTNTEQLGAIKVTKTFKHAASGSGDHPESGVSFTVNSVTKLTDANGVACFDGLAFASYTVHETLPTGYHVDANDPSVTVDNTATCSDSPYVGETVAFHNTPLTDITVSVNSQVDGGTSSTMSCTNAANSSIASGSTGANGDGSVTASNLEPGTYTCTVVVDP